MIVHKSGILVANTFCTELSQQNTVSQENYAKSMNHLKAN